MPAILAILMIQAILMTLIVLVIPGLVKVLAELSIGLLVTPVMLANITRHLHSPALIFNVEPRRGLSVQSVYI